MFKIIFIPIIKAVHWYNGCGGCGIWLKSCFYQDNCLTFVRFVDCLHVLLFPDISLAVKNYTKSELKKSSQLLDTTHISTFPILLLTIPMYTMFSTSHSNFFNIVAYYTHITTCHYLLLLMIVPMYTILTSIQISVHTISICYCWLYPACRVSNNILLRLGNSHTGELLQCRVSHVLSKCFSGLRTPQTKQKNWAQFIHSAFNTNSNYKTAIKLAWFCDWHTPLPTPLSGIENRLVIAIHMDILSRIVLKCLRMNILCNFGKTEIET